MSLTTTIICRQVWSKFTLQLFSLQNENNSSSATEPKFRFKTWNTQEQVKRPLNKFMLFVKAERPKMKAACPDKTFIQIHKELGARWKALTPAQQEKYKQEAEDLKKLHKIQYPNPNYPPKKRRSSKKKSMYVSQGKPSTNPEMNNCPLPVVSNESSQPSTSHLESM